MKELEELFDYFQRKEDDARFKKDWVEVGFCSHVCQMIAAYLEEAEKKASSKVVAEDGRLWACQEAFPDRNKTGEDQPSDEVQMIIDRDCLWSSETVKAFLLKAIEETKNGRKVKVGLR